MDSIHYTAQFPDDICMSNGSQKTQNDLDEFCYTLKANPLLRKAG